MLIAPLSWAENYLVADAIYQKMRVENNSSHNLSKLLPKYYEMFSVGYGYRTNSNWGFELGYQNSKKTSKSGNFAPNENLLFTSSPSARQVLATPKLLGVYLCAVGYHPFSDNSEFVGQFGFVYSKFKVSSNSDSFNASARGGVHFKASFGLQHNFGEFVSLRALMRYESTQSLKLAYREGSSVYYFKPFYDSWGLSVGFLIRF